MNKLTLTILYSELYKSYFLRLIDNKKEVVEGLGTFKSLDSALKKASEFVSETCALDKEVYYRP